MTKTLPQGRETRCEQLRAQKILWKQHRKTLGRIGYRIGINAKAALSDKVNLIWIFSIAACKVVLPTGTSRSGIS